MAFKATIVADSISPDGVRLTTAELTYPRIVHAEVMTHRMFARNSASTRAIPLATQLTNLLTNPFIPEKFGVNQKGMQAFRHLDGLAHDEAVEIWLQGRDRAVTTVIELILGAKRASEVLGYKPGREYVPGEVIGQHFEELKQLFPKSTDDFDAASTDLLNVHKQLAGRGLEAYMWHTIVLSATEFDNFFALRDHPEAQGEIATIARLLRKERDASQPRELDYDQWHTPYVEEGEFDDPRDAIKASTARTAAASYNRQNAKNPAAELERFDKLLASRHMSPFEHPSKPFGKAEVLYRKSSAAILEHYATFEKYEDVSVLMVQQLVRGLEFNGNYRGWTQYRKTIEHEDNFGAVRTV